MMTMLLLLLLVVPLSFGITTIVENAQQIADWSQSLATLRVPQPPAWVDAFPAVGATLAAGWHHLAAAGPGELSARIAPYACSSSSGLSPM